MAPPSLHCPDQDKNYGEGCQRFSLFILCALSGICFLCIGTENLTFKRGSFEGIEESAGLESGLDLDIHSLLIHKLAFWHHINDEINTTRQETTHDED